MNKKGVLTPPFKSIKFKSIKKIWPYLYKEAIKILALLI
ncbi:hypothetical protein HPHPA17_1311 [Helicobacter pylori Hp A-17]|nr:hypothetical protein HPHPA17_1311 [Helicobacter pylori Hp A-17]